MDGTDEQGQKDMLAYTYDRGTENKGKQFGSLPSLVTLHSHAWAYGGQFRLHDSVCTEVYSVCCQGD